MMDHKTSSRVREDDSRLARGKKMSIEVLETDDAGVMRQAICRLLHAEIEIDVVGEAADYAQTIQMTNDLKPQVIVLDLRMPNETDFTPMELRSQ